VAEVFGLDRPDVPGSYIGQLAYPFRRKARAGSAGDELAPRDQQLAR
jgi:hypothetical protein